MSRRWDHYANQSYPLRRIVALSDPRPLVTPFQVFPGDREETLECGHVNKVQDIHAKMIGQRRRCVECGRKNP